MIFAFLAALRETPWRLGVRLTAFVGLALGVTPATGFAQKNQFFDALLPLYRAAAGTYGDEGPRLQQSIDALGGALAQEDATLREAEARLRAQLRGGTPQAALQAHTTLASMYLERSRFADALREFEQDLLIDPKRAAFHRFIFASPGPKRKRARSR